MRTLNETLNTSDRIMGHWLGWTNDVMGRLDRLRTWPKTPIDVTVIHTEYTTDNGHVWECSHLNTSREIVGINPDESELATVCNDCPAQLIGEEWVNA